MTGPPYEDRRPSDARTATPHQHHDQQTTKTTGAVSDPSRRGDKQGAHDAQWEVMLRKLAPLEDTALAFLLDLYALGVPLWVAWPRPDYDGQKRTQEFDRPSRWEGLPSVWNSVRLSCFEPGYAVCANMGYAVAVVDVDPRNGGDVEKVRALLAELRVRVYAEVDTPGGGVHFYVADPGVHPVTGHKWGKVAGYPGVDVQVLGTNVFLPGTTRPVYGGRGYTVVDSHLADLIYARQAVDAARAELGDDTWWTARRQIGGADRLGAWLAEHTRREPLQHERTAPRGMSLLWARRGRRALLRTVAQADEGNRNNLLLWAGCRAVENGTLTEEGDDMWTALAEAASEAGLDDDEITATLASALNIAMEDQ